MNPEDNPEDPLAHGLAAGCVVVRLHPDAFPSLGEQCQDEVVAVYVVGCVAEHLEEHEGFCKEHLILLFSGGLVCNDCWQVGQQSKSFPMAQILPSGERIRLDLSASH